MSGPGTDGWHRDDVFVAQKKSLFYNFNLLFHNVVVIVSALYTVGPGFKPRYRGGKLILTTRGQHQQHGSPWKVVSGRLTKETQHILYY